MPSRFCNGLFKVSLIDLNSNAENMEAKQSMAKLFKLLNIQLTISFLIGRKRTVNFRNERLGPHVATDCTIIMPRTLKVTGNHVMYNRGP